MRLTERVNFSPGPIAAAAVIRCRVVRWHLFLLGDDDGLPGGYERSQRALGEGFAALGVATERGATVFQGFRSGDRGTETEKGSRGEFLSLSGRAGGMLGEGTGSGFLFLSRDKPGISGGQGNSGGLRRSEQRMALARGAHLSDA